MPLAMEWAIQKNKLYIMNKKKDLLNKIRKEYISYKKSLIK